MIVLYGKVQVVPRDRAGQGNSSGRSAETLHSHHKTHKDVLVWHKEPCWASRARRSVLGAPFDDNRWPLPRCTGMRINVGFLKKTTPEMEPLSVTICMSPRRSRLSKADWSSQSDSTVSFGVHHTNSVKFLNQSKENKNCQSYSCHFG